MTRSNSEEFLMKKAALAPIVLTATILCRLTQAANYVNSELPWHDAVLDSQGKLLAWYHPEKNEGYDKVLHLAWDFIEHKVPNDAKSGLKVYLVNAVFDGKTLQGTNWQGNPASMFGEFVDSVVAWYRSEEHTSELQSHSDLVCRLLLEKKKDI